MIAGGNMSQLKLIMHKGTKLYFLAGLPLPDVLFTLVGLVLVGVVETLESGVGELAGGGAALTGF
jgi:hypothetical protein